MLVGGRVISVGRHGKGVLWIYIITDFVRLALAVRQEVEEDVAITEASDPVKGGVVAMNLTVEQWHVVLPPRCTPKRVAEASVDLVSSRGNGAVVWNGLFFLDQRGSEQNGKSQQFKG